MIKVQEEDFDLGAELAEMTAGRADIGAVASFTGLVRDEGGSLIAMTLEHYPGMTEKALAAIAEEAKARWRLKDLRIVHRYGRLAPGARIVMVAAASAHRGDAFEAAGFVMDYLKTQAPFWKYEETGEGGRWVAARASDDQAAARWAKTPQRE